MKQLVIERLQKTLKQQFDVDASVVLTRPEPQFGDLATNVALQVAKPLGKNPRDIAEALADDLREVDDVLEVSIAGPGFINLRVSAKSLADQLTAEWSNTYGNNSDGAGKTVVVEYPSPNMAKPFSVGHLRPSNQGDAAKRLMMASGWNVISDNHLGDYGAPFGVWVVGFLNLSSDAALEKDGVYELGRIYIETKAALKAEKEAGGHDLADNVQAWLLKLEAGDAEATRYSKLFNDISLEHIHHVMQRLGIKTDHEMGEAYFAPKGKEAVAELIEKGVAVQNDDGSVIVPLDEFGFEVPLLVLKSNGAALYATTDLATMQYREANWHPDKVIHVVGAEQQFYFAQLFAMAKKLGVTTEFVHLWFGIIDQKNDDGTREKMSSRKGVVLMEDLLDAAEEKARALVGDRDVSPEDIKRIALGAVKFTDFIADRRKNILFDWDSIFALTGVSGPYVQYAAVRVGKILRDNSAVEQQVSDYDYEAEKTVILTLLDYPSVVQAAARDLEPHKVANYLYDLAREMNRYYETTRVSNAPEDEKRARLALLGQVYHVFNHGLGLLGIQIPERM